MISHLAAYAAHKERIPAGREESEFVKEVAVVRYGIGPEAEYVKLIHHPHAETWSVLMWVGTNNPRMNPQHSHSEGLSRVDAVQLFETLSARLTASWVS